MAAEKLPRQKSKMKGWKLLMHQGTKMGNAEHAGRQNLSAREWFWTQTGEKPDHM